MFERRNLQKIHKFMGLLLGGVILLQAFTGILLVYKDELSRWLYFDGVMERAQVMPSSSMLRPLQASIDTFTKNFPRHTITRIDFPRTENDGYRFQVTSDIDGTNKFFMINQYSGEVIKQGSVWFYPLETAFMLHHRLALGDTGHYVVGGVGILLVVMVVVGLMMWWPAIKGRFRTALTINASQGNFRLALDLHRVIGGVSAVFMLIIALTGSVIVFSPVVSSLFVDAKPASAATVPDEYSSTAQYLSVDELINIAAQHLPAGIIKDMRFSQSNPHVVSIFRYDEATVHPRDLNKVWLNRRSGSVERLDLVAEQTVGGRLISWMLPVHTGEALGISGRVLIFFMGGALVLIVLSGWFFWFQKRKRQRR